MFNSHLIANQIWTKTAALNNEHTKWHGHKSPKTAL